MISAYESQQNSIQSSESSEDYLEFSQRYKLSLNSQQERAVQAVNGANLLIAVPGSGKTTVLVARLGYMIICRSIPPEKILAMTYTTAAAMDMKCRFASVFGASLAERIQFRTINSVCYEIIRHYSRYTGRPAFDMLDDRIKADILRRIYLELTEDYPTESDIQEAESAITYIKNMMLSEKELESFETSVPDISSFYRKYDNTLKSLRLMDYDDQMRYSLPILVKNPPILEHFQKRFEYICVDEAQDTSKLQHSIIRLLASRSNNIFMVGDEDQSIYGFRAAYPQALMNFKNDYKKPNILFMEQNYRSTEEIVSIAAKFIGRNTGRYRKKLIPTQGKGAPVMRVSLKERHQQYTFLLDKIRTANGQTAVLYRDNDCVLPLIDLLIRNNIPYKCAKLKDTFFTNRTVSDVKAFISLSQSPFDTDSFLQIYYKCGFGFSKIIAQQSCDMSRKLGISVIQALKDHPQTLFSAVKGFEEFILAVKKYKPYGALCFIESRYGKYLQKNNIGNGRLEILKMLARRESSLEEFMHRLDTLPALISVNNAPEDESAVILSTIHGSKGLEYDTVYLMDVYDGILPSTENNEKNKELYQEERRLFYVAVTRAKRNLCVISLRDKQCSFADEILPHNIPENREVQKSSSAQTQQKNIMKSATVNGVTYYTGAKVIHRIHGAGVITEISLIDNNPNRHNVRIRSSNGNTLTYDLEVLIKIGLIKLIK